MTVAILSRQAQDVGWLISGFADRVPGVRHALVASCDGLPVVMSERLPRPVADKLSAITAGLMGVAECVTQLVDADEVHQTVIEMGRAYFLTMTIRDGSVLAAVAVDGADLGLIGFEMARLVKRAGQILTPALRAELQQVLPAS